ncbi:hypothetical protein DPEC_G00288220 [Dallia pectoralis]|uniref:Uncharacterized protein n=1 Tax=Dallia pectoralis TaxID=75939 RepID=A0ACC2FKI7_DALPE|nr:hypothetical protein DPEC_G00288220 [Dallia pectoralis]
MMDDGIYANQTLEFSPRKSGQGRNIGVTASSPHPGVPASSSPSPGVPASSCPSPGVPASSSPSPGVPASSSPSPGVPASPSRCFQILLVVLSFSLVCSLSALAAVSFLYVSRGNQSEFLPEETKSHLVSTPSANVKGCELCAKDWVFHGGKCYFFSTDLLNWTQSRDHCVSMDGHLVIINSQEEQSFLMSWSEDLWIGLNDLKTEGQWFWVDNEPLGQNGMNFWIEWDKTSKEPDNSKAKDPSGENCAALHYYVQFPGWVDVSCGELHAFVCEIIVAGWMVSNTAILNLPQLHTKHLSNQQ